MSPRAWAIMAVVCALGLSACTTEDEARELSARADYAQGLDDGANAVKVAGSVRHKDQHQLVPICVAAKTKGDYLLFKAILKDDNFEDVPRCSPLVEGEYFVRVVRLTPDGVYHPGVEYHVRAVLKYRADAGIQDLAKPESVGAACRGDTEQQTVDRLVKKSRRAFVVAFGEAMQGR